MVKVNGNVNKYEQYKCILENMFHKLKLGKNSQFFGMSHSVEKIWTL